MFPPVGHQKARGSSDDQVLVDLHGKCGACLRRMSQMRSHFCVHSCGCFHTFEPELASLPREMQLIRPMMPVFVQQCSHHAAMHNSIKGLRASWGLLRHAGKRPIITVSASATSERHEELVRNHRALLNKLPSLKCTIAGVTFEGRQEAVSKLRRFQPLLLMPEPSNPHDPSAVAVMTLAGTSLGYIPRDYNKVFTMGATCSGYVTTIGQVEQMCDPGSSHHKAAVAAAKEVCELTMVPGRPGEPLVVKPLWALDPYKKQVKLLRLVLTCQTVAKVMDLLELKQNEPAFTEAAWLVGQFNNGWRSEDTSDYLSWAKTTRATMDSEGWQVVV